MHQKSLGERLSRCLLALFLPVLIVLSTSANAGLIDNGDYITDTDSGLDWLKLTETQTQSYNYVNSQLGSGGALEGWAFASASQFDVLITNAGGTPMTCGNGTAYCGWSTVNNGLVTSLLSLFGDLTENNRSSGFLAEALGSNQWVARLMDSPGFGNTPTHDFISTLDNDLPRTLTNSGVGSFLIRQTSGSVPEPAMLPLLGMSAIGLLLARRRRQLGN